MSNKIRLMNTSSQNFNLQLILDLKKEDIFKKLLKSRRNCCFLYLHTFSFINLYYVRLFII